MLAASAVERRAMTGRRFQAGQQFAPAAPSQSVDMVFCHQTFLTCRTERRAWLNFHRVLKPGGVLLFAESTRKYIHSWIIRLLFRHPMEVQRTAEEYLAMIRRAGFTMEPQSSSYERWATRLINVSSRTAGGFTPNQRSMIPGRRPTQLR